jgi:hypothetical protein
MRVEVNVLEFAKDPGFSLQHQPALMMALRTGSLEVGFTLQGRSSAVVYAPSHFIEPAGKSTC